MSTNSLSPPFGPLYGSIFFGTIMSTTFYGVACMQTFFYYTHYESDPLHTKVLVAILCALNTIYEGLGVSGGWFLAINNTWMSGSYCTSYGLVNPFSPGSVNPELVASLFLDVLESSVDTLQLMNLLTVVPIYFFSGKNIILPLISVVLVLLRLVCTIVYVCKAVYSANGVHAVALDVLDNGSLAVLSTIVLSSAASLNMLIAIFMTFLLVRHWMETGFASTAHLLQRLIVFAANTGTWSATFSLLAIILLDIFPSNLVYTVFINAACPIYFNTLLANLNARVYVQGKVITNNVNLEWFTSPATDKINGNEQHGEGNLIFAAHQGIWNTTEVVTLPDANQSPTQINM